MSKFAELLANPANRSAADIQSDAEREFSNRVSGSRLVARKANGISPSGRSVILGVASYSPNELQMLDEMDASDGIARFDVQVFDVMNCRSHDDFGRFIPDAPKRVEQSPVVGVYEDGQLVRFETGLHCVRETLNRLGLLP